MTSTTPPHPLSTATRGARAVVAAIELGDGLPQRLAMLGIRRGVELRVVQGPDARGAVVCVDGARIALGRAIVERVRVVAP